MKKLYIDSSSVKPLGRTLFRDGDMYLILSGTGCGFVFTGKRLDITIGCDETTAGGEFCNKPRAAVYVNGRPVVKKVIEGSAERYTLVDSGLSGEYTVRIVKLSEAAFSIARVSIEHDDTARAVPVPEKKGLIEFIGDSITCGYGVDDSNTQSAFSAEAENAAKSYAILAAQQLLADYSLYSYSGHGFISGWTEDGTRNTREILTPWYGSYGFSYGTVCGEKPENIPWDSTLRQPDIVVVNIGTNDKSYCTFHPGAEEEFREEYYRFLCTLRQKNPDAVIIASLGIMGDELFPCIEEAAERFRRENEDRIYTFRFTPQNGQLGYGSNWHPSEETHQYAAEELAEFIKKNGIAGAENW